MRSTRRASCRGQGRHRRIGIVACMMVFVSSSFVVLVVDAIKYAKICELQSSPPVSLEYDESTRQFTLPEDAVSSETDIYDYEGVRRLTLTELGQHGKRIVQLGSMSRGNNNFLRGNRIADRLLDAEPNGNYSSKKTYIARSCPCDDSGRTYCLIDVDGISGAVPDSCGVPWSDDLPNLLFSNNNSDVIDHYNTLDIGCFELNSQTIFIRNAWPVCVLWYGALIIFLLATSNGKYARAYVAHALCPRLQTNVRQVERIMARENEMRTRLRAAAVRAANLAEGPGRYFVRTRGVRIPTRVQGDWRRDGMSEEDERHEATRWWLEQAEHLGILNSSVEMVPPQPVEYVLRTRTFSKHKERARMEQIRLMKARAKSEELCVVDNVDAEPVEEVSPSVVSTPSKHAPITDEDGPSTPETVATTLSAGDSTDDDDDEESASMSPNDSNDATLDMSNERKPQSTVEDDEDTFECTICLTEIEDGEQVGVLPCTHIMHVECLRHWIARKNACPLCQVTELASPRPVELIQEEGSISGDEDGNSEGEGTSSDRNVSSNEQGRSTNAEANAAGNTTTGDDATPWYMPRFFFPTSPDTTPRRSPVSSQSRLVLSASSSLSDSMRRRSSHGPHGQRRRRRRERRSEDFW